MTLRRGFRAEAERISKDIRAELDLGVDDPLPIEDAARLRDVDVVSAAALVDLERLEELERLQAFSFSACTFDIDGHDVIVFNPLRSEERRRSDIAHELSHLQLEHELTEIREVAGVPFRTCRSDQEEEATNLGGTLLLPRPTLLRAVSQGMSVDAIARNFGVTKDMAQFRVNVTGVTRQVNNGRRRAPSQ
jgi:Zn-dependent peptidase ImmA (M78 family)